MKIKYIFFAILLASILPITSFAENKAIESLFEKYRGQTGFTSVNISKDLLDMAAGMIPEGENSKSKQDTEGMKELVSTINGIKVLTYNEDEESGKSLKTTLYKDILKTIPFDQYKELLSVEETHTQVKIAYKIDSVKKQGEFIILSNNENTCTLVYIDGFIDTKSMKNISRLMKMDFMKGLRGGFGGKLDQDDDRGPKDKHKRPPHKPSKSEEPDDE